MSSLFGGVTKRRKSRSRSRSRRRRHWVHQKKKNQSHYRAHKNVSRATGKALKSIYRNVSKGVSEFAGSRTCDDEDVARVLDHCLGNMIETVREHVAYKEHLGLEEYPSPQLLRFIQSQSQKGISCVVGMLRQCRGDKSQFRVLADQYIQNELKVPSSLSDIETLRTSGEMAKLENIKAQVEQARSGLRTSFSSNPYSSLSSNSLGSDMLSLASLPKA